ncbi:MAG: TonB-dependent receptor plug domain-containing protein, partial [Opitutaceae bacterium]|nr:TonB-dependent receptor plug domain-containing protein [Opitutaceae bacterium]
MIKTILRILAPRSLFPQALLPLLVCALALPASAQQPSGVIEGRVLNHTDQKYLTNARVSVAGSIQEVFTNEFGDYRLVNLPAGEVTVEVFFTGMTSISEKITVGEGGRVTRDFELFPLRDQGDTTGELVVLDKFSVVSSRETSGNIIATNEQRFAANIKSVVETDAFGDSTSGNVGEFLKFMPGVSVDYDGADPNTVSVRGFGAAFTAVTTDGASVANAASGGATRAFQFDQLSINNIARVEVTKVPLPSQRADSMGGSVNMISKNSFDRKGMAFNYRGTLNFNSYATEFLHKTPGPRFEETYKAKPGFDFDFSLPVTRNFGIVLTGMVANQYNEQRRLESEWDFNQRTLDYRNLQEDPYLRVYRTRTAPKAQTRESAQIRTDWRVARNHIFSLSYNINYLHAENASREMVWDVDDEALSANDENPDDPYNNRKNRQWGRTPELGYYVESPEGRGLVRQNTSSGDKYGLTHFINLKYRYTGNNWELDASVNGSTSKSWQRDVSNGAFSTTQTEIIDRFGRLGIYGIHTSGIPDSIKAYAKRTDSDIAGGFAYGEEIDVFDLASYNIRTARSSPYDAKDTFTNLQLNTRRTLTGLPFVASFKIGGDYRKQERDIQRYQRTYTFIPSPDTPELLAMKNASNFIDESYSTANPGWGMPDVSWVSPKKVYDRFVQTAYPQGPVYQYLVEPGLPDYYVTRIKWHGDYFMQTANQLRDEAR